MSRRSVEENAASKAAKDRRDAAAAIVDVADKRKAKTTPASRPKKKRKVRAPLDAEQSSAAELDVAADVSAMYPSGSGARRKGAAKAPAKDAARGDDSADGNETESDDEPIYTGALAHLDEGSYPLKFGFTGDLFSRGLLPFGMLHGDDGFQLAGLGLAVRSPRSKIIKIKRDGRNGRGDARARMSASPLRNGMTVCKETPLGERGVGVFGLARPAVSRRANTGVDGSVHPESFSL
jgi:hypothetical protein